MGQILVIEDSPEIQRIIKDSLRHFDLHLCGDLKTAQERLKDSVSYDLILLDIGLPDGDGFRFLTALKNQKEEFSIPVIFLTSRTGTEDIVMGFSIGADDYITKPFNPFEFRARIESKMRTLGNKKNQENRLRVGRLTLHLEKFIASYDDGLGAPLSVDLTPLEFKILTLFAKNQDQVFNRDQIIDRIWGVGTSVSDRVVDTHISNIRRKMSDSGFSIFSIYGTGYVLRKMTALAAA